MQTENAHPATLDAKELLAQCRLGRGRASGPGGQHRNKVQTAVTLTHEPTGVLAQASERRSAEENKRVALFRLRLALATRVRSDAGAHPSALWLSRLRGGRIECNPSHTDYPALLAEALDVLDVCAHDPKAAGERLECTPTQLIHLIRAHRPAMGELNAHRTKRGLHALK